MVLGRRVCLPAVLSSLFALSLDTLRHLAKWRHRFGFAPIVFTGSIVLSLHMIRHVFVNQG